MVAVPLIAGGASTSYPRGEVVVRPECFAVSGEEVQASPSPSGTRRKRSGRSGGKSGAQRSPGSSYDATPPPSPPPAVLSPAEEDVGDLDIDQDALAPHFESEFDEEPPERREAKRTLEWGAKVFLSNDDSMSLASAQRVLYTAMNGLRPKLSEIRPHELLNYFSFDVATPDRDQMFDVLASAEQHGDELSVALAVKGATPERQPLDLTLLIDRSCSMEAEGRMNVHQARVAADVRPAHPGRPTGLGGVR